MKAKHKYITRLHYRSSHGWWVRIRFAEIQKAFSDIAHGSKAKSLKAAIKFREVTLRDLANKGIRKKPVLFHKNLSVKNRTGVIGVFLKIRKAANGTANKYYVGSYYPEKYLLRSKLFAVNIYGEREALRLAVAFRREGLRGLRKGRKAALYPTYQLEGLKVRRSGRARETRHNAND